ncbi:MAG: MobC family plasmid mobilization relaxosome protein, partial [Hyphomicrobiales bacterium]|nr:MobC family plasmid mobilization relaxosome protein [Hyphomicrobiales bacterium]
IFGSRIAPKRGTIDQALLVELNRVGVNLNQIAHKVNAGRSLPPDFPDVLAEVRAAVRKVLSHGS